MPTMEETFDKSCQDRIIPGAILLATDTTGTFEHASVHGVRSLQPNNDTELLTKTTPLAIASCTKLLTTICCLQLVEQGKLALSTDVTTLLPDLAALPILVGFTSDDKPITRPRTVPITLQHLLTHSSGLGYDGSSPLLMKWCAINGKPTAARSDADKTRLSTVAGRFSSPLLFTPGTSWTYGSSLDWAGKVVEVVSGLDLDAYMCRNIFARLAVAPYHAGFWLDKDAAGGMALTMRDAQSGKVRYTSMQDPFPGVQEAMGGQGLKATMPAYFKVLKSLLRDNGVLLRHDTIEMMWKPCLSEESKTALNGLRKKEPEVFGSFVGRFPEEVELDWGLGGMLSMNDDDVVKRGGSVGRKKGTMMWSGLPNLFWFINREVGIAGLFGTQVLPPGDAQTENMIVLFEKEMYARHQAATSSDSPTPSLAQAKL